MSISNPAEMYLLATLSNGDWTQWYRGEDNNGGLNPQLLTNPFFETDLSGWTATAVTGSFAPSWDGNSGSYTQGWVDFKSSSWGKISQTVTGLTVGDVYHIITNSYAGVSGQLYIKVIDGSSTYQSETLSTWTANSPDNTLGLTFTAQNTSVTVEIYGYDGYLNLYEVMMRKNDRWLALLTAAPTESAYGTGDELSGNGYERVPICFGWRHADGGDGESATMKNSEAIEFPEATASWGTVTHIAIFSEAEYVAPANSDAAQDEKYTHYYLWSTALTDSKTVESGDIVRFERLSITLEADPVA